MVLLENIEGIEWSVDSLEALKNVFRCMLINFRHLSKTTMAKILSLKPLLNYFSFEPQLLWHSKLRMLHCLGCHIKSPFLCSFLRTATFSFWHYFKRIPIYWFNKYMLFGYHVNWFWDFGILLITSPKVCISFSKSLPMDNWSIRLSH
jgi:hypothetical protein